MVQDWQVLNLMNNNDVVVNNPQCYCNAMLKGPKKGQTHCLKVAKYKNKDKILFFCEKHAKQGSPYLIPKKEYTITSLKKKSVEELNGLKDLIGKVENLEKPLTKAQLIDHLLNHVLEPLVPAKVKTAGETDLITVGRNMRDLLDTFLLSKHEITHVIIENQISPIATRMKTIQGMLAQYFLIRFPTSEILFVSSSHKLAQFKGLTKIIRTNVLTNELTDEKKEKYNQHKKDGILFTYFQN
jgi:hypothetical protein